MVISPLFSYHCHHRSDWRMSAVISLFPISLVLIFPIEHEFHFFSSFLSQVSGKHDDRQRWALSIDWSLLSHVQNVDRLSSLDACLCRWLSAELFTVRTPLCVNSFSSRRFRFSSSSNVSIFSLLCSLLLERDSLFWLRSLLSVFLSSLSSSTLRAPLPPSLLSIFSSSHRIKERRRGTNSEWGTRWPLELCFSFLHQSFLYVKEQEKIRELQV